MRRRRVLLDAAKESGCGVLALGHTLDDFAETLLLNLAYAGSAEGFAPKRLYFGEIAVVRPFILTRKREILPARPGRARS